jgi:hypothetical protein
MSFPGALMLWVCLVQVVLQVVLQVVIVNMVGLALYDVAKWDVFTLGLPIQKRPSFGCFLFLQPNTHAYPTNQQLIEKDSAQKG